MSYDAMSGLLNGLAADFMFIDGEEIDIPAAGAFLNQLDKIAKEAEKQEIVPVGEIAVSLSTLMEKIIMGAAPNDGAVLSALDTGISTLQSIIDAYCNEGSYEGDNSDFMRKIGVLTGVNGATADISKESESSIAVNSGECDESTLPEIEDVSAEGGTDSEIIEIGDESLLKDFIAESLEYIGEIEVNILNLERNPEDKEYINAIFRPFHSIKGVASFLSLDHIRDLAHNLENVLDKSRNGELEVTSALIDVVLDSADALKMMIGQLRDKLEGRLEDLYKPNITSLVQRIAFIEKSGGEPATGKKIGEILVEDGVISQEMLTESLKSIEASPGKRLGETLITEAKVSPRQVSQALRKQTEQVSDMSNIRVDTRKLDDLIDMVGELVITQAMVQEDIKNQVNADKNLVRDVTQFIRMTSQLQKVSTSLRMVPIKQTFQRMARLVRDLAKSSGKRVAVEMEGEDTEIDRNMVDEIYNPLVHMIRNSVDHGIEMPEERVAKGKSETGLIRLQAYHRGGTIVIAITDDGKGLDKKKILDKAIKNGVIASGDGLTEQEIYKLIFLPGLSTAEKVTDVSGRGVGMDVVRGAVEKLRGKIEIESSLGTGTTFIASFPLTLAIIDGMIVKVGPEYYILPTTVIHKVLRPLKEKYNNVIGNGEMINVMGKLLPLVRLYELFNITPEHEEPWEAIVIVIGSENNSKCLMVDNIIGKTEVVIKSLGSNFGKIKGVSGAAILGDGRIGLILDAEGIFTMTESRERL